ncbi:hypothetical protein F4859DRAFT_528349 [Xylaria cf. heliscus]|nr:hypothetical protein F4859DRAFT_528349 [Xylaria cf. heliscus]
MRLALSFASITLICAVQGMVLNREKPRSDSQWGFGMTTFTRENFCANPSFRQEDPSGAAPVGDCKDLVHHLNTFYPRAFGIEFIGWDKDHLDSPYVVFGTRGDCEFSARPIDANDGPPVVTYGDAADIVNEALAKLSIGDKIRGSGVMDCQTTTDNQQRLSWTEGWEKRSFEWQVYKPGAVPKLI